MIDPALEDRFKQLAAAVSAEDWDKLVQGTTERIMQRLVAGGVLADASPEQLTRGIQLVGSALVDYTNVALTTVALGQLAREAE